MESTLPLWRRWAFTAGLAAVIIAGVPWLASRRPEPPASIRPGEKGTIPPSGGEAFIPRMVLSVPSFLQADERWGKQAMGPAGDTMASAGCAVCSTAMVLASYGVDTDPSRLNGWLASHEGYTPQGWLKWEAAATLAPEKVRFVYEDLPSHRLIDENLHKGNPVIVRVRFPSGITHFVVICGKDGYDYLIQDPGSAGAKGVYPLKDFGSPIEALRFYERLPATD